MRLPVLIAAAALLAPAAALAHDMNDPEATPEMAGATWRRGPPPPPMAGAPYGYEPAPAGEAHPYGPPMPPPDEAGADRPPMAPFAGRRALPPPPYAWRRPMGPAPMRFAGPPSRDCTFLRPVRLHDGWLSWHGKSYF